MHILIVSVSVIAAIFSVAAAVQTFRTWQESERDFAEALGNA